MTEPAITVYTGSFCGHCMRVRALLERRGLAYTEVGVEDYPHLREELLTRSGRRTLPQVYVGGRVGGADELAALEQSGELLRLIEREE